MKLPRDTGGAELAALLVRYGYQITRQTGSHMRLTSSLKGKINHVTIPQHKPLKIGTLSAILNEIAAYLEIEKEQLIQETVQLKKLGLLSLMPLFESVKDARVGF